MLPAERKHLSLPQQTMQPSQPGDASPRPRLLLGDPFGASIKVDVYCPCLSTIPIRLSVPTRDCDFLVNKNCANDSQVPPHAVARAASLVSPGCRDFLAKQVRLPRGRYEAVAKFRDRPVHMVAGFVLFLTYSGH